MNIFVKKSRALLVAAAIVLGTASATHSVYAQQSTDKAKGPDKSTSADKSRASSLPVKKEGGVVVEVPIIVMVPVQVSNDLAMRKGCWVKLYDKKDYEGDSLMLVGPVNLGQMIGPFGFKWENKVRSLETGPNANLTIYDNRNFRDQDKFIDPNKRIPDLSKKMGFFDDFRSMMLSCI